MRLCLIAPRSPHRPASEHPVRYLDSVSAQVLAKVGTPHRHRHTDSHIMGGDTHQHRTEEAERTPQKELKEAKNKEEEGLQQLLCGPEAPEVLVKRDGAYASSPSTSSSFSSTCTTPSTPTPYVYKKGGWGARHTVVVLACSAVILISMMRYSLSIAIVSMASRHPHMPHTAPAQAQDVRVESAGNDSMADGDDGGGGVCPAPDDAVPDYRYNDTHAGFDWDERTQGLMLGAFYYGNVLTNILGGRMAERCGSKPVILLGVFFSAVFSLLSPLAAYLSTNVFIGVRLCLGLAQGIVMPAISRFVVVWVPPNKRSKYQTMVFIGSELGTVFALSLGGWLCAQPFLGGWPAVFYMFGGAGVVWCLAWVLAIHESPDQHPRITSEEKKYLLTHCIVRQEKMSVPWGRVLRCLPFWAVAVMHVGYNWGHYTFISELPAYLSHMQHFSIKSNGLMSALPYVIKTCFSLFFCLVMDRVTAKGKLSLLSVRRLSMVVASYIPAVALVGLCFVGCNSMAAVAVVSAAISVTGASFCGLFCSHQDISPHFSGTLFGVTNTLGNTMGFLAPAVIGFITYNNQTVQAWNTVFLLSALVYAVAATFYISCISDQVQAFDSSAQRRQVEEGLAEGKDEEAKGEHHASHLLLPPDACKK